MRTAKIYFNGLLVEKVQFKKMEVQENGSIALSHGFGDGKRIVAVVPSSHLIITED